MNETTGNPETEKYLILAQELMRRVYSDMAPDAIHSWLMAQVQKTAVAGNESAVLTWLESLDYYDQLLVTRAEQAANPDGRHDLIWAWDTWNRMLDPLESGLLAVIAAGDGVGKTIYAETQAEFWAKYKQRVVFVHFELNRAVMLDRRAARHTGINRRELKSGPFTDQMRRQWHDTRQALAAWDGQITYLHTPGWSMERLTHQLKQHISDNECDVVIIDYLEKAAASEMQVKLFGANAFQREANDVEILKNFAESTETPVVLLAQMSKAGKDTSIHNLTRTAIRGAGEKTEKANIVALLSREKTEDGYASTVDVRIDKNTLGPTGNFQQYMDGAHFRVLDMQR